MRDVTNWFSRPVVATASVMGVLALTMALPVAQGSDGELIVRSGTVRIVRAGVVTRVARKEGSASGRSSAPLTIGDVIIGDDGADALVVVGSGLRRMRSGERITVERPQVNRSASTGWSRTRALLMSVAQPNWSESVPVGPHRSDLDPPATTDPLMVLYPAHGTSVLETRPEFAWSITRSPYEVQVFRGGEVFWRQRISGARTLRIPADRALTPGETYTWDVTDAGGTTATATFAMASEKARQAVEATANQLREELRRGGTEPSLELVAVAGLFAERGFQYEAARTVLAGLRSNAPAEQLCLALQLLVGDRSIAAPCGGLQ